MPEGDTLWRTAEALRERILGQVCQDVRPSSFRRLIGRTVTCVEARGKHLFIRFDSGLSLHSHLRMKGAWYVLRRGEPFPRREHEVKVVLAFDDWIAVLFSAPVAELVRTDDRVAYLGPDILGDNFDPSAVLQRALEDPDRSIGETLLDQRVCAGIGNIYKCESLWALGLDPWTATGGLDTAILIELYVTARRMMISAASGSQRVRRRAVYGRAGRSCSRCLQLIQVRKLGTPARLTYWCPRCQPQVSQSPMDG